MLAFLSQFKLVEFHMPSAKSAFYSFMISLYIGCFYFGIGTLMTLAQGQSMGKFLFDFVVVMFAFFALLSFAINELQGAFDKLNQPREHNQPTGESTKNSNDDTDTNTR